MDLEGLPAHWALSMTKWSFNDFLDTIVVKDMKFAALQLDDIVLVCEVVKAYDTFCNAMVWVED